MFLIFVLNLSHTVPNTSSCSAGHVKYLKEESALYESCPIVFDGWDLEIVIMRDCSLFELSHNKQFLFFNCRTHDQITFTAQRKMTFVLDMSHT